MQRKPLLERFVILWSVHECLILVMFFFSFCLYMCQAATQLGSVCCHYCIVVALSTRLCDLRGQVSHHGRFQRYGRSTGHAIKIEAPVREKRIVTQPSLWRSAVCYESVEKWLSCLVAMGKFAKGARWKSILGVGAAQTARVNIWASLPTGKVSLAMVTN